MGVNLRAIRLVLAFGMVGIGCVGAGRPIPLAVHQGATFVLPLSNELAAEIGYGLDTSDFDGIDEPSTPGRAAGQDGQRGTLVFVLCPLGTNCMPGAGVTQLTTRYVTRLELDAAAEFSILGGAHDQPNEFDDSATNLQLQPHIFAVIDIPTNAPTGLFSLLPWIQLPGSTTFEDPFAPVGAFGPSFVITVLAGPQTPNDAVAQSSESGTGVRPIPYELLHSRPRPKLVLEYDGSASDPGPAAAEITLTIPASRLWVLSAYENDQHGQASIVRLSGAKATPCFEQNPTPATLDDVWSCFIQQGPDAGEVTIHLVDLDGKTREIAVVFYLSDPTQPVLLEDFGVTAQVWDWAGEPIPGRTFTLARIR